jgi:hypothetical protein
MPGLVLLLRLLGLSVDSSPPSSSPVSMCFRKEYFEPRLRHGGDGGVHLSLVLFPVHRSSFTWRGRDGEDSGDVAHWQDRLEKEEEEPPMEDSKRSFGHVRVRVLPSMQFKLG